MIKKITINKFRCFNSTSLNFRELTIMVGKNNAGKSTLIEALRIAATITKKFKNLNFVKSPYWVYGTNDVNNIGVEPSIANLNISQQNVIYLYEEGPANILVEFENNSKVEIFINSDMKIFALLTDENLNPIVNKRAAKNANIPIINILPQIYPLLEEEKKVKLTTVNNNINTRLSSRNFRNQLICYKEYFNNFKNLAEETWDGMQIEPMKTELFVDENINLIIRDGSFAAEVGWMGHGLQMWLQIMWFISRCEFNSTIILDEPDVYMHADLQKKLINLISYKFKQVIIATHSIEIISEVDAGNIVNIDKRKKLLTYATNLSGVQKLLDTFGSIHNLDIIKMFSSKKILFVEGDFTDKLILDKFYSLIFPKSKNSLDTIPSVYVNGWGGWQKVIGGNDVFKQNGAEQKVISVFDSDYHLDKDITDRYIDAKKNGIYLHIWKKKEIENYLLNVSAIYDLILNKKQKGEVSKEIILDKIKEIVDSLTEEIIGKYADEISSKNSKYKYSTNREKALEIIKKRNYDYFSMASGKTIMSKLSEWASSTFKVNINCKNILKFYKKEYLESEIIELIKMIDSL